MAAFILFVAIDSVVDAFRTVTIVGTTMAAVAAISPKEGESSGETESPRLNDAPQLSAAE